MQISVCRTIDRQRRPPSDCMLARSLHRTLTIGFSQRTRRAAGRAHLSSIWRNSVQHASLGSHARTLAGLGGDPFSSWIAPNPLPDGDAAPQQIHQQSPPAQDPPRLVTRRYHYAIASAVVRTLSQTYGTIQYQPDRKAFLLSGTTSARIPPATVAADLSDVLPPQARPVVSLKLPIVLQPNRGLSGADGTALLQSIAAGKARPGRMLIALLTADSAALALWKVCSLQSSSFCPYLRTP